MPKTEHEIINEARDAFGPLDTLGETPEKILLAALEAYWLNGIPDGDSGSDESPTGHFYRVDRWIVVTDSQGFHTVHTHEDVIAASHAFDSLEKEFGQWAGHDA